MHAGMSSSYTLTVVLQLGVCVLLCYYYGQFVLGLVILCLLYFLDVIIWLTVPLQSIVWKVQNALLYVKWDNKPYTHSLTAWRRLSGDTWKPYILLF